MTTPPLQDTSIYERRESSVRSYCRAFPTVFTKATGATMTDASGREYIDFLAGCSSLNYGHNDPDMKAALVDHITADGVAHGLDMHTDAKSGFLATFERLILQPRGMDHRMMFVGPTGANAVEAVEAALKLARKATGRTNVIAFTTGFHGMTLGALAATGNLYNRGGAGQQLTGITRMPFEGALGPDIDTAEVMAKLLDEPSSGIEPPAAIILETVQGEGGLNPASNAWVKRVAEIARDKGALLIIDDIQAGIGRSGTFFSFDEMGIEPDIITMAKSLSGFGLPFAAVLVRPKYDVFKPAEHNGTFRGNNHAFERLTKISKLVPGSRLKGRGMFRGVDVGSGELASKICAQAFEDGLIIETSGSRGQVVKVLAPLTIDADTFARGLDIVEKAVTKVVKPQEVVAV